jgi:hypothetical protein
MKRAIFIPTLLALLCFSAAATALEGPHGEKNMVVGAYLSSGFAMVAGKGYENLSNDVFLGAALDRTDRTAKYGIGGTVYFDFYFTSAFAVDAGIGFTAGGIRFKDADYTVKEAITYMEIPVCFKVDYKHFQGAAGLVLSVALSGRTTAKDQDTEVKRKWNNTERWQYYHRANLGPRLAFSYAIPVGPVYLVPGISWTMHLINDLDNDEIHNDNPQLSDSTRYNMRANSLMLNVGVEWGFSSATLVVK